MGSHFIYVRGAQPADANAIIDIDIKCFESAWSPDEWVRLGQSPTVAISVATDFGTPVGAAVFEYVAKEKAVRVAKIAVKNLHRKLGVSRQLLEAANDFAQARAATHVYIIVPESTIYPGPQNVSNWLKAVQFEATEFVKKHFTSYGETEDGVKFVKSFTPRVRLL